jgi:hypothetical protein
LVVHLRQLDPHLPPWVKAWNREYADRGLVVVGLHAPEVELGQLDFHSSDRVTICVTGQSKRGNQMIDVRELIGVSLIGLMAITAAGCGDASRATATPPPAVVKVEPVVERDVPISVEYVGTLVGYINAQIRARVAGHRERRETQVGQDPHG